MVMELVKPMDNAHVIVAMEVLIASKRLNICKVSTTRNSPRMELNGSISPTHKVFSMDNHGNSL